MSDPHPFPELLHRAINHVADSLIAVLDEGLSKQFLKSLGLHGSDVHSNLLGYSLKLGILGHEVGLAKKLNHGAHGVPCVDVGGNDTGTESTIALLRSNLSSFFFQ